MGRFNRRNISKGKNERFSSSSEQTNGERNIEGSSSKNEPENEDIYGYSKNLSSTDVDADMAASEEYEPIDTKGDAINETVVIIDESVERRKKKRRDRRKTNSESSCTKVEIPAISAEEGCNGVKSQKDTTKENDCSK